MINILVFLEELLIGFVFTIGLVLLFYGFHKTGISSIIISSIAYYLRRRRISNE